MSWVLMVSIPVAHGPSIHLSISPGAAALLQGRKVKGKVSDLFYVTCPPGPSDCRSGKERLEQGRQCWVPAHRGIGVYLLSSLSGWKLPKQG